MKSRQIQRKIILLLILIIPAVLICKVATRSIQRSLARSAKFDETHCRYVSTLGLKKICQKTANCIYLSSDQLSSFVVPNKEFILITSYSDATVPDDFPDKAKEILSSPYLIKWLSGNLTAVNDKLSLIPIGLDYHSVVINPKHEYGAIESPVKQEKFLQELPRKPFYAREIKIYCNFLHAIRGRYGLKDRAEALNQIPHELIAFEENFVSRKQSWHNMIKYSFVLSPLGNGLDCHRTWEALVLGAIPIVKSGPLDPLYADLPVLIVKEWSDVNLELLQATLEDFKTRDFNYAKLTLQYWSDKI